MKPGRHSPVRYDLSEVKSRLSELVRKAMLGEDVIISRGRRPILKLVALARSSRDRRPGTARGQVWMAPDFDATPADFRE